MELDHEYGQLARIKNLTDEVLQLKEKLSTCKCTEQLLAARCAMPPGDTRPGRAAHANPYAVDVRTGVWSIFGLKEMTVEELKNELKNELETIEAEYERCKAEIAYFRKWLEENAYSLFYALYTENKNKNSILLPVYVTKIKRLKWLIKHSEEIATNPDLQAKLKNFDAQLKYMNDSANVELRDLEQTRLLTEAHIQKTDHPRRQGMHTYYGNRYGWN
jgi:hypothetical protein